MLRSAAAVLLTCAPLVVAAAPAPAHAAPQRAFPCTVAIQKISDTANSKISLSISCAASRTVGVSLSADGAVLLSWQQTVQAGVQQSVTLTVPKVTQACATLQADSETTTLCTP
ncbi:hypothetical protein [Streptomyces bullii]